MSDQKHKLNMISGAMFWQPNNSEICIGSRMHVLYHNNPFEARVLVYFPTLLIPFSKAALALREYTVGG